MQGRDLRYVVPITFETTINEHAKVKYARKRPTINKKRIEIKLEKSKRRQR